MAPAKAIQIVTPVKHEFQLQLEELKRILNSDDIKDRHCVIISIAGAFRKGKSFLLNFFLKYLYAQVKQSKLRSKFNSCSGYTYNEWPLKKNPNFEIEIHKIIRDAVFVQDFSAFFYPDVHRKISKMYLKTTFSFD